MPLVVVNVAFGRMAGLAREPLDLFPRRAVLRIGRVGRDDAGKLGEVAAARRIGDPVRVFQRRKFIGLAVIYRNLGAALDAPNLCLQLRVGNIGLIRDGESVAADNLRRLALGENETMLAGMVEPKIPHVVSYQDAVFVICTFRVSPESTEREAPKSEAPMSVPVVPLTVELVVIKAPPMVAVAFMLNTAFEAELSTD